MGPELRQTLSRLRQGKGLTAVLIATFGLGVAVNVVVFAIFRGVLLRPLSFPESDRVVITLNQYPRTNFGRVGSSVPNYFERKQGVAAFAEVAALRFNPVVVGTQSRNERVAAGHVTASFFPLLAIKPELGRFFDERSPRDAVVISDAYWRQILNGDQAVLGQTIRINGSVLTIIGVTPRDFRYPSYPSPQPLVWLPLDFSEAEQSLANRHATSLDVIARLQPGATVAEAQSQLDVLNARRAAEDPERKWAEEAGYRALVTTLREDAGVTVRAALYLLQVGAGVVLLVGIANALNLLLIRQLGRAKEFAVRRALGATAGRLGRQIALEAAVLAGVGGLVGLGGGAVAVRFLAVFGAEQLPRAEDIALEWPVAAMALVVVTVGGVIMALPGIFGVAQQRLSAALSAESQGGTASASVSRLRRGLITVQVALAFVLVTTASLLGISLQRVLAIGPGFEPKGVLTGVLSLPAAGYDTEAKRFALLERLQTEVRAQPGMQSVGVSSALPFASIGGSTFAVDGNPAATDGSSGANYLTRIAGDYFQTLQIPRREGRWFTEADARGAERVCIVDEAFARAHWPNRSPLGYHVFQGSRRLAGERGAMIVGVVGTVREGDPAKRPAQGTVYFPATEAATGSFFYLSVRAGQAGGAITADVRRALTKTDPALAWSEVRPFQSRIEETHRERGAPLAIASAFGAVALVLAAIGMYGVIGYEVERRRREIGIRSALGARPGQIAGLFMSLAGRMWLAGLVIGLGAMLALHPLIRDLLYGASLRDGKILIGASAFLAVMTAVACLPQVLRAARISPMQAIKGE